MKIITDTREQTPYTFTSITPRPDVIKATLRTGDYSLSGFEDQITIERKSLSDTFGTFGRGRRRFVKELERMAEYDFAAVVIEADWSTILRNPPTRSKLSPTSVYASVIAWMQRHDVHFIMCPNRAFAEKTTYRLLERYWKDHKDHNEKRS